MELYVNWNFNYLNHLAGEATGLWHINHGPLGVV